MGKFLTALCLLALFLYAPQEPFAKGAPATIISVKEAAALLDKGDVIILDVRTPAEFAQGHLPGARNMDFFGGRFDHDAANLPADRQILLYCSSGKRSAGAAEALKGAGVKKILDMHQGFQAWEKAGMPVEK
ncbi:MAG: rhodanese-like domain-containing protein [Desulfovibrio sp.]|nr:rhodanese-like domain-containing protein [Desulfovibrio sp.]